MSSDDPGFDQAVVGVIEALTDDAPVGSRELHVVQSHLDRGLQSRFPTLGEPDRGDIIADALVRLIAAARQGRINRESNPAGYLWRIAENRAIDLIRQPEAVSINEVSEPPSRSSDDEVAALLEAAASSSDVKAAMRLARNAGEHRVVQTISRWLVVAERMGRAPSTREAGEALSVSHDTVARHLRLFGEFLARVIDDPAQ
jgi:DNA-directed RNA polymerase specialized sigma24 family protein